MSAEPQKHEITSWITRTDEETEPGYDEDVRAAIAESRAQIAAGLAIPAEKVWEDLGIE
jgi:hypothetical protein